MAKKPHEHSTHHPREISAESVDITAESVEITTKRAEQLPEHVSTREATAGQSTAPEESELAERSGASAESLTESLTEATESVMTSVKEEAAEAREAAAGLIPTLGNAIHQGVYSSFYYVTYGIVFSALVIGRWIPADNAMGEGVHDGADAARKAFEERAQRTAEPTAEEEGLVTPA